jgi:hypothetical protein
MHRLPLCTHSVRTTPTGSSRPRLFMKRKVLPLLLVLCGIHLSTRLCRAQLGVGANFTVQHIDLDPSQSTSSSTWVYGPTFSIQDEHGRFLKLGLDARGSILRGSGVGVDSFDAGPRIAIAPRILPIKPYGEVLLGGIGVRPNSSSAFTTHVDLQYVVGVDTTIFPHLDWRVLEYTYGRVLGFTGYANEDIRNQLGTGLILRLF